MKIFVKVKPSAKKETVKKITETNFTISVKELPKGGKANLVALTLLAQYLKISRGRLRIVKGSRSRQKIIQII